MKRVISLCLVVAMVLAFAGCGSAEPQSATLLYEADGVLIEYCLDALGDKCQTLTQTSYIDCADYTDEEMQLMEDALVEYADIYAQYEGVTYSTETEGTVIKEIIVLDISSAELVQSLSEAGLLPITGSAEYISLKKTVEGLTEQGWELQE